jgi:hypothetical protein
MFPCYLTEELVESACVQYMTHSAEKALLNNLGVN